jgi:hypothetical protein
VDCLKFLFPSSITAVVASQRSKINKTARELPMSNEFELCRLCSRVWICERHGKCTGVDQPEEGSVVFPREELAKLCSVQRRKLAMDMAHYTYTIISSRSASKYIPNLKIAWQTIEAQTNVACSFTSTRRRRTLLT